MDEVEKEKLYQIRMAQLGYELNKLKEEGLLEDFFKFILKLAKDNS